MIEIISASYRVSIGGWQNTALACPGEHSLPNEFYDLCSSQRSCKFNISAIFIGDKCQRDIKRLESYLEISYSCEGNHTVLYKDDVDVTLRHHIFKFCAITLYCFFSFFRGHCTPTLWVQQCHHASTLH